MATIHFIWSCVLLCSCRQFSVSASWGDTRHVVSNDQPTDHEFRHRYGDYPHCEHRLGKLEMILMGNSDGTLDCGYAYAYKVFVAHL